VKKPKQKCEGDTDQIAQSILRDVIEFSEQCVNRPMKVRKRKTTGIDLNRCVGYLGR